MKKLKKMIVSVARWAVGNIDKANQRAYCARIGLGVPAAVATTHTLRPRVITKESGWPGPNRTGTFSASNPG
jgi:hypothetical protein